MVELRGWVRWGWVAGGWGNEEDFRLYHFGPIWTLNDDVAQYHDDTERTIARHKDCQAFGIIPTFCCFFLLFFSSHSPKSNESEQRIVIFKFNQTKITLPNNLNPLYSLYHPQFTLICCSSSSTCSTQKLYLPWTISSLQYTHNSNNKAQFIPAPSSGVWSEFTFLCEFLLASTFSEYIKSFRYNEKTMSNEKREKKLKKKSCFSQSFSQHVFFLFYISTILSHSSLPSISPSIILNTWMIRELSLVSFCHSFFFLLYALSSSLSLLFFFFSPSLCSFEDGSDQWRRLWRW